MTESDAQRVLVELALEEDVGEGDWTTDWTVDPESRARAQVLAKEDLVVAGTEMFRTVYRTLDPTVSLDVLSRDGSRVKAGDLVIELAGPTRVLLTGERTALNFLGRLSGIATLTRHFVDAVQGTDARIFDTRKTTPGWRGLEKAAVRAGGGSNHRFGLHDMVLIKENHILAAGGIGAAIARVLGENREGLAVEVEVRDLTELDEALEYDVQRIMLDNMSPAEMADAVRRVRSRVEGRPELEASGNVGLERVRAIAESGVDVISVGALTHSAPSGDFTLLVRQ